MNAKAKRIFNIIALALIVVGLLGFAYPLAANIYDWFHQTTVTEQAKSEWAGLSAAEELKEFELAKRYNEQLAVAVAGSAVSGAEPADTATGAGISGPVKEVPVRYDDVFRNFSIFSTIAIPSIGIDALPIRHGVSDEVLWQGAGHLPNTSFPIGGDSTHAVITAHSGLINHSYFTDLPNIKVGDYFYFNTLGRHLSYRVISVKTIEPTDTSSIAIVPGRDLASLITCVPIGINTHRLLVTGERADDAPEPQGTGWLRPFLSGLALLLLALLLLLLLFPCSRCRIVIAKLRFTSVRMASPPWSFKRHLHFVQDDAQERATDTNTTWVEGRLRFAIRTGDKLLVKEKRKNKSKPEGENKNKSKAKSKHIGQVIRIFVPDDADGSDTYVEDVTDKRMWSEDSLDSNEEVADKRIWSEVYHVKSRTLVRFEVKDLEICEMPHDTLVRVRRQWSLFAMMCLPLAFVFPLFVMVVHADTPAYATLVHESAQSIAPYLSEDRTNTVFILSLLLFAELIIMRIRLFIIKDP